MAYFAACSSSCFTLFTFALISNWFCCLFFYLFKIFYCSVFHFFSVSCTLFCCLYFVYFVLLVLLIASAHCSAIRRFLIAMTLAVANGKLTLASASRRQSRKFASIFFSEWTSFQRANARRSVGAENGNYNENKSLVCVNVADFSKENHYCNSS